MSHETYEQYLTAPGTVASLSDVARFDWHRRTCTVCGEGEYAYTRCPEGGRLAQRVTQPAVVRQTNQEISEDLASAAHAELYLAHESESFA